jgi:protein-tyrosine phosphatase
MIEIHCHILPGIDDGPVEAAESMAMAKAAAADGIRMIVATPIFHTAKGPASR